MKRPKSPATTCPGTGAERIVAERLRQIAAEGWSPEHDDGHRYGEIAVVAAVLACDGTDARVEHPDDMGSASDPWGLVSKHRGNRIRQLEIAGALLAAEIDREIRLAGRER